jgi:hypothetical protein
MAHYNQAIPWSQTFLEKPAVTKLLKNFPIVYETRRLISMLKRAHHLSLFWAGWIQSTSTHPISLISILILYSNLCLYLPSTPIPSQWLIIHTEFPIEWFQDVYALKRFVLIVMYIISVVYWISISFFRMFFQKNKQYFCWVLIGIDIVVACRSLPV